MSTGMVIIDQERCKGCALCVAVCPQQVLTLEPKMLNARGYHPAAFDVNEGDCTGCSLCAVICPDVCITVLRKPLRRDRMQMVTAER